VKIASLRKNGAAREFARDSPQPLSRAARITTREHTFYQHKRTEVLARCPELEAAAEQVRAFAKMMTQRQGHRLEAWITATVAGGDPPWPATIRTWPALPRATPRSGRGRRRVDPALQQRGR
jgi:hypothetical protein